MAAPAGRCRAIPSIWSGKAGDGQFFVMIYRGDYWQCAYLIPKGGFEPIKADGLDASAPG